MTLGCGVITTDRADLERLATAPASSAAGIHQWPLRWDPIHPDEGSYSPAMIPEPDIPEDLGASRKAPATASLPRWYRGSDGVRLQQSASGRHRHLAWRGMTNRWMTGDRTATGCRRTPATARPLQRPHMVVGGSEYPNRHRGSSPMVAWPTTGSRERTPLTTASRRVCRCHVTQRLLVAVVALPARLRAAGEASQ